MSDEYYKDLSKWWERQWDRSNYVLYALVACVLLIIAYYLVSFYEPASKIQTVTRSLTLGVIVHTVPTLIIIIVSFVLFKRILDKKSERERTELLAEIEKRIERTALSESELRRMLHDSGLQGVYEHHHRDRVLQEIGGCQRDVDILHTYLLEPNAFEHPLVEASRKGAKIRILLLNPESPIARQRSLDLWPGDNPDDADENYVSSQIRLTVGEFKKICKANKLHNFEMRLYNALLSVQIFKCDENLYLGFYPKGKNSFEAAQLKIHGNTFISRQFFGEFNAIWHKAQPVRIR